MLFPLTEHKQNIWFTWYFYHFDYSLKNCSLIQNLFGLVAFKQCYIDCEGS